MQNPSQQSMQQLEASFSVLTMSIASSAVMSLGLAPNPHDGNKTTVDKDMARFNIDLLLMLKEKTTGNLNSDETQFLQSIINDLQTKFLNTK
jgi:hypothetical protein